MEKDKGVRSVSGYMFLVPESILLTTLIRSVLVIIESEAIKLGISDFNKSVEKRSYFKIRRVMIDRLYLWCIPLVLIYSFHFY